MSENVLFIYYCYYYFCLIHSVLLIVFYVLFIYYCPTGRTASPIISYSSQVELLLLATLHALGGGVGLVWKVYIGL